MDDSAYDADESEETVDIDEALGEEGLENDNTGIHELDLETQLTESDQEA